MILRRLMRHMKEQNWFAVGLDLIVVVVGIFLGMQVNNWNEAHKERLQEKEYLVRLLEDAQFNKNHLTKMSEMHRSVQQNSSNIARYITRHEPDQALHESLAKGGLRAGLFPDSSVQTGTYDEIISSGNISLLRDSRLKGLLRRFAAEQKRTEGQLEYSRTIFMANRKQLDRSGKTINTDGQWHRVYNFTPLIGDQPFLEAVGDIHRRHELMALFYEEEVDTLDDIIREIGCQLRTTPCQGEQP